MRTEGDMIKIRKWLLPLSWIYGLGVRFRNHLFEIGAYKSRSFMIPVISVGNITVGGSGKTPHVEYLIRLLNKNMKVAVLSRGYKRKSKGYILADEDSTMKDIGDEPFQMKRKFDNIYVAVDKDRCHGIDMLTNNKESSDVDVILLDDAFQHRYVKPGINILLVDYHRLIIYDKLLPAGQLREPLSGKDRADIVIVTKCPKDLKPMEYRVLIKQLNLFPYQELYFTTFEYESLKPLFPIGAEKYCQPLGHLPKDTNIMLLTGIASPKQMKQDIRAYCPSIYSMAYGDHHFFTPKDIVHINNFFEKIPEPKIIITTEKDATRLQLTEGLSDEVKARLFTLPIHVHFMLGKEESFNTKILSYVQKNSRNSILAKRKDDHKPTNSNHPGNRPRTISFRNN